MTAHGYCLRWDALLVWTEVIANGLIALSYYSIPVMLMMLYRRNERVVWNWLFSSFSAFIFFCGTTHVMHIVTIWFPIYWTLAFFDCATALASVFTAVGLVLVMPVIYVSITNGENVTTLLNRANQRLSELLELESGKQTKG